MEEDKHISGSRTIYSTENNKLCVLVFCHPQTILNHGFSARVYLRPTPVLIYVNDFNYCLTKSKAIMFADDTTVWTSHKNTSTLFQLMQSEMELSDRWLVSNCQ